MSKHNFSHIGADNQPAMVDVSAKVATRRIAVAEAHVWLPDAVVSRLKNGEIDSPKGPVFQTAIVAGVMACKKTPDLIPFCHPLQIEDCKITIEINDAHEAVINCRTTVHYKTGVEMEALTGATVAALTIYDMCKGISHDIVVREIRLIEKQGGKSGPVNCSPTPRANHG